LPYVLRLVDALRTETSHLVLHSNCDDMTPKHLKSCKLNLRFLTYMFELFCKRSFGPKISAYSSLKYFHHEGK